MDGENPLPLWLRQALIGLGLFLAGGLLSFGYSYRPLHGALTWEIEQLETRLDERNRENLQLSDALARHKSSEAERIDPETLAQVEKELEQTKRVLRQAEKDLKYAESKRRASLADATKWRKRYEELRDAPPPELATTPDPNSLPAFETAPAAPGAADAESPGSGERGILLPDNSQPDSPTTS